MKSNRFWTTEHNEAGLRRKPHVQHVSLRFVIRSRAKLGNNLSYFFIFCSARQRGSAAVRRSRRTVLQPFQSESPSALLSEIGNPLSWTRFLASSQRGDGEDDTLLPLDSNWNRTQLGFILISSECCVSGLFYGLFFIWISRIAALRFSICRFPSEEKSALLLFFFKIWIHLNIFFLFY